jgi:phosphoribosyl 1,2-cyclic phosphate phosphodiesterase
VRVTFLGTGTSHGVPAIGCRCETCSSADPRDRRWRPSILLTTGDGASILVDASPDLRAQALEFGVLRVDALLLTHAHADHILGFDELRQFNRLQRSRIPCYGDRPTVEAVRRTFAYAFDPATPPAGGIPRVDMYTLAGGPFSLCRHEITPVPLLHGTRPILGFRTGRFAYLTDCSAIPDASWPLLEGLEVVVLDALRDEPHPTHLTVAEAVDVARRLGAARTLFTHMSHTLRHEPTSARLPRGIELAYDGLTIDL